jgi:hypothetical protein
MGAAAVHRRGHRGGRTAARTLPGGDVPRHYLGQRQRCREQCGRKEGARGSRVPAGRTPCLPDPGGGPGEQLDLAGLRAGGAGVRRGLDPPAVRHPAAAGRAAAESHTRWRDVPAPIVQHRYQLYHRHQLAGLRGGNPGQLPHADGWPGRRAVHRGRCRAGGGPGRGPRHRREGAHDRQLLGRSHQGAGACLRPLVGPVRAGDGGPGRGSESQRFPDRRDAGRRRAEDPRRPGRLDGGHQAARHQRRQLLRRRRRPPVREPDRVHEYV